MYICMVQEPLMVSAEQNFESRQIVYGRILEKKSTWNTLCTLGESQGRMSSSAVTTSSAAPNHTQSTTAFYKMNSF